MLNALTLVLMSFTQVAPAPAPARPAEGRAPMDSTAPADEVPSAGPNGLRSLAPSAAEKAAILHRRPLVLVATASWSAPSQRLVDGALADADVRRMLADRAIAIPLDVPRAPDAELQALLERHRIVDLPALVVLEAGGAALPTREIGRVVGVRDAAQLQVELGKLLEAARPSRALLAGFGPGAMDNPGRRFELARALVGERAHGEALEHLLWCYDRGGKSDPGFRAVRNGAVLAQLLLVAREHEPAKLALDTRRAAARAAVEAGVASPELVVDFVSLCRGLGRRDEPIAVYDTLVPGHPGRAVRRHLFEEVVFDLVAKGRDADALEGAGDPTARVERRIEEQKLASLRPIAGAEALQLRARQRVVEEGLLWYGPLLRTDRRLEANALADRLIAFEPSDATFAQLVRIALASGKTGAAKDVLTRGRAMLSADRRPALEAAAAGALGV